jgi:hypothetical protein
MTSSMTLTSLLGWHLLNFKHLIFVAQSAYSFLHLTTKVSTLEWCVSILTPVLTLKKHVHTPP